MQKTENTVSLSTKTDIKKKKNQIIKTTTIRRNKLPRCVFIGKLPDDFANVSQINVYGK